MAFLLPEVMAGTGINEIFGILLKHFDKYHIMQGRSLRGVRGWGWGYFAYLYM